jgi:hypothetical protein
MYQVWKLPGTQLDEAPTSAEAYARLDAECRRRYDEAVAAAAEDDKDEDATSRFQVRDAAGEPVAWVTYTPDVAMPYQSPILDQDEDGDEVAEGRR